MGAVKGHKYLVYAPGEFQTQEEDMMHACLNKWEHRK